MTADQVRAVVLRALGDIAPEADPGSIEPGVPLRDQLDLDSMDVLNFVVALDKALGVAVPEADYPRLVTLDGCVGYLVARLEGEKP